jgi:hypothetical protein
MRKKQRNKTTTNQFCFFSLNKKTIIVNILLTKSLRLCLNLLDLKNIPKTIYVYLYININIMGALELRHKLTEQFNLFIQDDSKLVALDGIFDSMNVADSPSLVSEDHYTIVEERYRKYHAKETITSSWEEVKQNLNHKHGF